MLEGQNHAEPNAQHWSQWLLWAGCSIFTVFLSVFIYIGTTSRFLQDDYCFSVILSKKNLLDIYLHETTFSSNRFMLVLTTALSERLGAWSVQVLPGFLLVMWVLGLTLTLRQVYLCLVAAGRIGKGLFASTAWLLPVMVSEMIVVLSLYAAPNRIQVYYWRAGSLTYLAPLVVFSFLAWWMIRNLQRPKISIWAWIMTFLLAFAAAGYSETAAVFQMGGLALATAVVLVIKWALHQTIKSSIWLLVAGWIGSLAAVVILLSSPANAPRMAASYPSAPDVWRGIWGALDGAFFFMKLTFYWLPVTAIFVLVFFALLSFLVQSANGITVDSGKWILMSMVGVMVCGTLCIAASMFPSYYIESSYPGDRALLTARWISMIVLASSGWLLGALLKFISQIVGYRNVPLFGFVVLFGILAVLFILVPKDNLREASYPQIRSFITSNEILVLSSSLGILSAAAFVTWAASRQAVVLGITFLIAMLVLAQPLHSLGLIFTDLPGFSARATLWDRRDAQIRQMAAAGQQDITVGALDSLAEIFELHDDPNFWVNRCASWYYQVSSIQALEPVLTLP